VLVVAVRRQQHHRRRKPLSITSQVKAARRRRRYRCSVTESLARPAFGMLLRTWRQRRRLSQLDLALETGVSARHVSFLETGRSQPSREMVLRLADQLDVPRRERNPMLLSAGYAPAYPMHTLDHEEMAPVRDALDMILGGYQPYPALAVDRSWNLVAANPSVALLTGSAHADLLAPPVNVLRLSLHPRGLAPAILNLAQWRGHILDRLAHEAAVTADTDLAALHRELLEYPGGTEQAPRNALAVPLRLRLGEHELAFLSTVTTFSTAIDITLAELSIEAFLPADQATAETLRRLAAVSPDT
jgi:transcriptional regulator with XRE-family HTH domain